jgi:hypothetical protein
MWMAWNYDLRPIGFFFYSSSPYYSSSTAIAVISHKNCYFYFSQGDSVEHLMNPDDLHDRCNKYVSEHLGGLEHLCYQSFGERPHDESELDTSIRQLYAHILQVPQAAADGFAQRFKIKDGLELLVVDLDRLKFNLNRAGHPGILSQKAVVENLLTRHRDPRTGQVVAWLAGYCPNRSFTFNPGIERSKDHLVCFNMKLL